MGTAFHHVSESELADLLPKIKAGERISRSECLRLWKTRELTSLGVLANVCRERVSGNSTFFRSALHMNFSRKPEPACPLCNRLAVSDGSPVSPEEQDRILLGIDPAAVSELHLVGGYDGCLAIDDLCRRVRRSRELRPNLHIRAFTWSMLEKVAERDRSSPSEVFSALWDAGLRSLAGGTLMDLTPDRPRLVPESIGDMERRFPAIEAAANLGFTSELSWIYGDSNEPEVVADTLDFIRTIQDRWRLFECFVPLLVSWPAEEMEIPIPTGYNELRSIAVGRIFLDNVPHVRSPWSTLTESMMQVAQWYGADDADSAILPCNTSFTGVSGQDSNMGRERMEQLLRATGRKPVDALAG